MGYLLIIRKLNLKIPQSNQKTSLKAPEPLYFLKLKKKIKKKEKIKLQKENGVRFLAQSLGFKKKNMKSDCSFSIRYTKEKKCQRELVGSRQGEIRWLLFGENQSMDMVKRIMKILSYAFTLCLG